MKFYDIKEKLNNLIVFTVQDIYLVDPNFRRATLYDWESAGRVIKLRNNKYVFSDFKPTGLDYYVVANYLYKPSYISLELALNHYGVIPESVLTSTSVTTNKTKSFDTVFGYFSYRSLDRYLYFGYEVIEHKNHGIALASLEKAILDYIYLNHDIENESHFEYLRWDRYEIRDRLDVKLFKKYLKVFSSKALNKRVSYLLNYIKSV